MRIPGSLACLASGAALPLAFAPLQLVPIACLAPALLFHCWNGASPARAFRYGWLFGFGMFGVGVNWLHISINMFGGVNLAGALAATLLMVAGLALLPAAAGWTARRYAPDATAAFLIGSAPAAWVLAEWVRTWIFTGFPWLHLGYSQSDTVLGALAAGGGVFASSWAVALVAGLIAALPAVGRRGRIACIAGIAVIFAAGWLAAAQDWTNGKDRRLSVALIQGSVPQELKWRPEYRELSMQRYLELTEDHWDADLIVWPETAIPAFRHDIQDLLDTLSEQAHAEQADLYVGLPIMDQASRDYYNGIVLLDRPGTEYHKRHLVPFGEYLPLRDWLGGLFAFLRIPMSNFSPGAKARPLLYGSRAVAGVSICYEDAFGEEVIAALPDAELLINVSNDAWFGDSWAPHQHLQIARLRAIETGRYLLRATNSGISAVIDEKGRVLQSAPQFRSVSLRGTAQLFEGHTPYSRLGNLPIVAAALLLLLLLRRGFANRESLK